MTTPPNYRRVECCGTCKHAFSMYREETYFCECRKHIICAGPIINICDDYEPEDGE